MCSAPFSLWRLPPSGHVRPSSTEHTESVLTGKQESRGCFLRRDYQVPTAYSLPYHEFSQGSNWAPPSAYDVPEDDCLPFYKPPKLLIQSFKKKMNSFICVVWLGLIYLIQDTLRFLTVSKYPNFRCYSKSFARINLLNAHDHSAVFEMGAKKKKKSKQHTAFKHSL